ncbi:MAG: thiol:disulfide interchange protein DsbA/DsbL [Pseudomonadota bacterium]
MRLIRTLLCAAAFGLCAVAAAAPAEPKNGADYLTLLAAQNTDAAGKVEVTEFFAYYCPHCERFEPLLAEWVRKQGNNIVFKRVHVAGGPTVVAQQRLFYTLEALGQVGQYHQKVFDAIHVEKQRLGTDQQALAWAAKAGIDQSKFTEAWNSFGLQAKLRRANALTAAYRVDSWPLVAIDGRYITSPSQAAEGSNAPLTEEQQGQAALRVMDFLVAKAKAEKK